MFTRLLVPLDGSRLAESSLSAAAAFVSWFGAAVTLLHVIEKDPPRKVHGDNHLVTREEASAYLDRIAKTSFPPGAAVDIHVHESPVDRVADSIFTHSDEFAPDLIVLCTHGGGGIRERIFGSIAQKVFSLGKIPVLLVRPEEASGKPLSECLTILAPIDSGELHGEGLAAAETIARASGALLHIMMAVPTLVSLDCAWSETGRLLPGTTEHLLAIAEEDANDYLAGLAKVLKSRGIDVQSSVRRGDPADMVADAARETGADLVVLGTHGRSGIDAFWSESVAPGIVASLRVPLLLMPVKES